MYLCQSVCEEAVVTYTGPRLYNARLSMYAAEQWITAAAVVVVKLHNTRMTKEGERASGKVRNIARDC